ncbi:MAG: Mov34/MPN/PAD-1 family protein [Chloroflexota bacterium]|jgi:proteasome lid subunit RPN8/RPN11
MTQTTEMTYLAQIILALPGHNETASITVTLVPTDTIPVGGHVKPLADCTLAELRAFANTLEADIWKTYDAITLHQLREEAAAAVEIKLLDKDESDQHKTDHWMNHVVVFGDTPPSQPDVADSEANTGSDSPAATTPKPVSHIEPEATIEQAATPPLSPAAEGEPAVPAPTIAPTTNETEKLPPPPTIIPSQARVRVAGGRIPLDKAGGAAVDILMDESPLRAMQAHALSSLDREVAGVMVGQRPEKQPDGRYVVHIIDSIAAKYTVTQGASVTYTPESWRYLNDTLWERYPDDTAVMVGWYHTHPGFGIFLSGMDLFIHQNFFTQIWHVAYVLDPRARTSGFFCWNRPKTHVNRYEFRWPAWAAGSW